MRDRIVSALTGGISLTAATVLLSWFGGSDATEIFHRGLLAIMYCTAIQGLSSFSAVALQSPAGTALYLVANAALFTAFLVLAILPSELGVGRQALFFLCTTAALAGVGFALIVYVERRRREF